MGSPPRSRGRLPEVQPFEFQSGITPAFAGKAHFQHVGRMHLGDHPRVRGEGASSSGSSTMERGSPPRSRGRRFWRLEDAPTFGITPAFAGKAPRLWWLRTGSWDHPRVRGEGHSSAMKTRPKVGSPPRSRGRHDRRELIDGVAGITPAFAGKAMRHWRTPRRWRDHPRVRGEGCMEIEIGKVYSGSPPRSRGRHAGDGLGGLRGGITPAFAGKAGAPSPDTPTDRDHPRVRGEGENVIIGGSFGGGSPPRSRGRLVSSPGQFSDRGITPAFAGKAGRQRGEDDGRRDHPRVRGEGYLVILDVFMVMGSPPRSRGRRGDYAAYPLLDRITPAFAGKADSNDSTPSNA